MNDSGKHGVFLVFFCWTWRVPMPWICPLNPRGDNAARQARLTLSLATASCHAVRRWIEEKKMSIALNRLGALEAGASCNRRELTAVQLVRVLARIEQRENTNIHA